MLLSRNGEYFLSNHSLGHLIFLVIKLIIWVDCSELNVSLVFIFVLLIERRWTNESIIEGNTRGLFLNRSLTLFLSRRESFCTDFSFCWCLVSLQGLELRGKSLLEVVIDHRNQLFYISY